LKRSRVLIAATCALVATTAITHAAIGDSPVTVNQTDQMWTCSSKQSGTIVNVNMATADDDAVHLDAGCTGSIVVHITTATRDGMKIHTGAHDLQITGDITCTSKVGAVHQDGIQAMGGKRVLIGSTTQDGAMVINCPTGNNGGVWINEGKTGNQLTTLNQNKWPQDIVVDHADVFERNAAIHIGEGSVNSGVRNSVLHEGTSPSSPPNCVRVEPNAINPIIENNSCVPTTA
jgi:hypothetical protein